MNFLPDLPRDIVHNILEYCDIDTRIKLGYFKKIKIDKNFSENLQKILDKFMKSVYIFQFPPIDVNKLHWYHADAQVRTLANGKSYFVKDRKIDILNYNGYDVIDQIDCLGHPYIYHLDPDDLFITEQTYIHNGLFRVVFNVWSYKN